MKKKNWFEQLPSDLIDATRASHDPFSEKSLFLSKQFKQHINHCSNPKQWSPKLEHRLFSAIAPDFQQKFPSHPLKVSTLKKNWELYQKHTTDAKEKGALTPKGNIHLPTFIKAGLKKFNPSDHTNCHLHPGHYAHQLAVKMGECIAVVDGIRPKIDQLTNTIWSLQRHLLPHLTKDQFISPCDERESSDKLIIQTLLEETAKHPGVPQTELAYYIEKRISSLKTLFEEYTSAELKRSIQALHADLFQTPTGKMEKILADIPYWMGKLIKKEIGLKMIDAPNLDEKLIQEQTMAFFHKARIGLNQISDEEIDRKIQVWTNQGEMILRWIGLHHGSSLMQTLEEMWTTSSCINELHQNACLQFLQKHPHLSPLTAELHMQAWTYLRSLWYTKSGSLELSTFDRFVLWHKKRLGTSQLSAPLLLEKITELCSKALPLLPFNRVRIQTLLFTEEHSA